MQKMPKLFECARCGATFERMLIETPELCSRCARRCSGPKVALSLPSQKLPRAGGASPFPRLSLMRCGGIEYVNLKSVLLR